MSARTPGPRPKSAAFVTFGDIRAADPHRRTTVGVCRFCQSYHVTGVYYSTRAGCCFECADKRKDEVLPAVAKAEKKALRLAAERVREGKEDAEAVWWTRHFSGVNTAFAEWAVEQAKKGAA
jgi:hypothetical protein